MYRLLGFMSGQCPQRTVINIWANPLIKVSSLRSVWALSIQALKRERERERESKSTRAAGEEGAAKRTAETAPKGAIVIEIPLGAKIWSILPNIAIAANAPIKNKSQTHIANHTVSQELMGGLSPFIIELLQWMNYLFIQVNIAKCSQN